MTTKWTKRLPEMRNRIIDVNSDASNTQIVINWNEAMKVLTKTEKEVLNAVIGKLQDENESE